MKNFSASLRTQACARGGLPAQVGFTLIELLVVIGIIAILATIVIVAINPARQFAQARNSQRVSNVTAILNAIGQNIADNKGVFMCDGSTFVIGGSAGTQGVIADSAVDYDLAPCLIPTYLTTMPTDPTGSTTCSAAYVDENSYNTCYSVARDTTTGRITVSALAAELGEVVSVTR